MNILQLNVLKRFLVPILLTIIIFSCIRYNIDEPTKDVDNVDVLLTVRYNIIGIEEKSGLNQMSVSGGLAESKIGYLYFMFFKESTNDDNGDYVGMSSVELPVISDTNNNEIDIKIPSEIINITQGTSVKYNVLVFGNYDDYFDEKRGLYLFGKEFSIAEDFMASFVRKGEKYDKVISLIYSSLDIEGRRFHSELPFFGESILSLTNKGTTLLDAGVIDVDLVRNVSIINVISKTEKLIDISMIKVCNYRTRSLFFGENATIGHIKKGILTDVIGGHIDYVDYQFKGDQAYGISKPVKNVINGVTYIRTGHTDNANHGLYSFPNLSATPTLGDTLTTCLIIAATYQLDEERSVKSFYRLNLNKKNQIQTLESNHTYDVIIKDVLGEGFATEQDAYDSKEYLMDYVILENGEDDVEEEVEGGLDLEGIYELKLENPDYDSSDNMSTQYFTGTHSTIIDKSGDIVEYRILIGSSEGFWRSSMFDVGFLRYGGAITPENIDNNIVLEGGDGETLIIIATPNLEVSDRKQVVTIVRTPIEYEGSEAPSMELTIMQTGVPSIQHLKLRNPDYDINLGDISTNPEYFEGLHTATIDQSGLTSLDYEILVGNDRATWTLTMPTNDFFSYSVEGVTPEMIDGNLVLEGVDGDILILKAKSSNPVVYERELTVTIERSPEADNPDEAPPMLLTVQQTGVAVEQHLKLKNPSYDSSLGDIPTNPKYLEREYTTIIDRNGMNSIEYEILVGNDDASWRASIPETSFLVYEKTKGTTEPIIIGDKIVIEGIDGSTLKLSSDSANDESLMREGVVVIERIPSSVPPFDAPNMVLTVEQESRDAPWIFLAPLPVDNRAVDIEAFRVNDDFSYFKIKGKDYYDIEFENKGGVYDKNYIEYTIDIPLEYAGHTWRATIMQNGKTDVSVLGNRFSLDDASIVAISDHISNKMSDRVTQVEGVSGGGFRLFVQRFGPGESSIEFDIIIEAIGIDGFVDNTIQTYIFRTLIMTTSLADDIQVNGQFWLRDRSVGAPLKPYSKPSDVNFQGVRYTNSNPSINSSFKGGFYTPGEADEVCSEIGIKPKEKEWRLPSETEWEVMRENIHYINGGMFFMGDNNILRDEPFRGVWINLSGNKKEPNEISGYYWLSEARGSGGTSIRGYFYTTNGTSMLSDNRINANNYSYSALCVRDIN